jgi:hypothetical protein
LGRQRDVELEVAGHRDIARAHAGQARGIAGGLRGNARERREHRARQRGKARIARSRFFGQPGVDEAERYVALAARGDEIGPDLVSISSPTRGRKRARNASMANGTS